MVRTLSQFKKKSSVHELLPLHIMYIKKPHIRQSMCNVLLMLEY